MATETRQLRTLNTGSCPLPAVTFQSAAVSRPSTLTRNNCAAGLTGSTWTINIPAGAYTSNVSQAAADAQATAAADALDTQTNANNNANCVDTRIYLRLMTTLINLGNGSQQVNVMANIRDVSNNLTTASVPILVDYYLSGTADVGTQSLQLTIQGGNSFSGSAQTTITGNNASVEAKIHVYSQDVAAGRNIVFVTV